MTTEHKLDKIADDVTSIKISIARMEEQLISKHEIHERIEARLDTHEKQLDVLERRPGRWWDKLLGAGLIAAAGTFVVWMIDKLK